MANIQPALTTTAAGAGSNLVRAYFDRVLLERVHQETRFYQFAEKRPLPTAEGNQITWNRKRSLDLGFTLSEGVPTSTGNTLSTTSLTATIAQYGAFVPISDLIDITSLVDVGNYAAEELADQAARTVDRVISNAIINHASASDDSGHYIFKTSAEVTEYWGIYKKLVPVIWQHITRKFSLINGENLRLKAMATLRKALCHLHRLSERTTPWVDATVGSV